MKEKSFTRNRSGGWLSIMGRVVFLVLFALCWIGVQQVQAQIFAPMTGSGSSVNISTFNADIGGDVPDITDPCSCSASPGCFDDEITITSPANDDVWLFNGSPNGLLPTFRNGDPLVLAGNPNATRIPLVGSTVINGVTFFVYSLEVTFCNDAAPASPAVAALGLPPGTALGFTFQAIEANGRYGNFNTLTTGDVCFIEQKVIPNLVDFTNGNFNGAIGFDPEDGPIFNCLPIPFSATSMPINLNIFDNPFPGGPNNGTWTLTLNGTQVASGAYPGPGGLVNGTFANLDLASLQNANCGLLGGGKQVFEFSYDPGTAQPSGFDLATGDFNVAAVALGAANPGGVGGSCGPIVCEAGIEIDYCPFDNADGDANVAGDDAGVFVGNIASGSAGNYDDTQNQIVTICPDDPDLDEAPFNSKRLIRFNFFSNFFSTSSGDRVRVYDGDDCTGTILIDNSSGISNGNELNGGWVDATCANPTGCLTFEFIPKNDGRKGRYGFNYEKIERSVTEITCPADATLTGTCQERLNVFANVIDFDGDGLINGNEFASGNATPFSDIIATHTIGAVTADCNHTPNMLRVGVTDPFGRSFNVQPQTGFFDPGFNFGVFKGTWSFEYIYMDPNPAPGEVAAETAAGTLVFDFNTGQFMSADTCTQVITVVPPPPVCNGRINVGLGLGCSITLTPDMVLEDPCNTFATGGNILYEVTTDKNGDGDFTDDGEDNVITSCGIVNYQVRTFMDMPSSDPALNFDGVIGENDMLVGSCWGEVNAEDNNPITVNARLKTLADRQADSAAVCDLIPVLQAQLVLEQDTAAWDVDAVAIAADAAANAAAALALKPDNTSLIAADAAAQADLAAAMATMTASAAEVTDLQAQIAATQASCTNLTNLLNTTNGLLIACSDGDITDAEIMDQIVIDTSGMCGTVNFSTQITRNFGDECGNAGGNSITVVVTGTKSCGSKNTSGTATVTIPVIRPAVVAPADVLVDCGMDIIPDSTGFPKLDLNGNGIGDAGEPEIGSDAYTCSFIAEFTDEDFASCGQGSKTIRTWRVLDWCPEPPVIITFTQSIEVQDTFPPVMTCPDTLDAGGRDNPHLFTTDDDACGTTVSLTTPTVTDQCDGDIPATMVAIRLASDSSMVGANLAAVNPLACGNYIAEYTAIDGCGNAAATNCFVFFNVVDDVTPTALCEDEIQVALGNGDATIPIGAVDAGSNDNCPGATMGIRIKDSGDDLAQTVTISCEGKDNPPVIELVITDKNGVSTPCWTDIVIKDAVPPVCTPPADRTINCDEIHPDELANLTDAQLDAMFGAATCSDNLACIEVGITQSIEIDNSDCSEATITRSFVGTDWNLPSDTVTQTITVVYNADWKLTFPADDQISCGDEFPEASSVNDILESVGFCDRLSVNVEGQRFTGGSDACVKMVRTYTVWNSCGEPGTVYNVNSENDGGLMVTHDSTNAERIVYVQTITADITDGPTISTYLISSDSIVAGLDKAGNGDCSEMKEIEVWAKDCLGADVGEGNVTIVLTDAAGDTLEITEEYVADGAESFWVVGANVGTGDYTIDVWATDGCGNSSGNTETITFVDAKAPSIYVLNGVATHVMPTTGTIDIWADDFIEDVIDCDAREDLTIAIWHTSDGETPDCGDRDALVDLGQSVEFDCDYIGTQLVRIYAMDVAGNCDFVETYIIIQDNGTPKACSGSDVDGLPRESQVAGKILNPAGDLIESVNVAVNGLSMSDDMMTTATGTYLFSLEDGGDYTITPEKNINPLNGVSTFDLVLISKHILEVDPFTSAHQYIAADINNNGSVTAFDIVQLRQLILNITSEFTNNTSWRFVDATYDFGTDVTTTLSQNFPEFMNINNLDGDKLDNDFVAIKVGDVNGSAVPNSLASAEVRTAAGALTLNAADRFVEAGETVEVSFTAKDIANVTGYQFTMNYDGLELVELVEGTAKADNFNTKLRGALATSWNGTATAGEVLFAVNFTAATSGLLSDLISLSSDVTTAEAYSTTGEVLEVAIEFTEAPTIGGFELMQNKPNPFGKETVIGFTLPSASVATIRIMDLQSGRVLKSIQGEYDKGYNEVMLNANELGATGVLYYQLESADNTATRKMIIIE